MKRVVWMTLLVGTLSAGSCLTTAPVTGNDFCLVNSPMMPKDRAVSDYISDNDPRLAEGLIVYNTFGERECEWRF